MKRKFSIDQATDTLQYLSDHAGTMTLRCQESKKYWNQILCNLCLHQVKTQQKISNNQIKSISFRKKNNKQHHVFKTLIQKKSTLKHLSNIYKHIFTALSFIPFNHRHVAGVPRYDISLETCNCYRCEEVQGLSPWIPGSRRVSHETPDHLMVVLL